MSPLRSRYDDGGTRELVGRTGRALKPNLAGDEHVILYSQGGYKDSVRPIWKLGQFYLTDRRLIFSVPTHVIWEVPLGNIKGISVEQRRYVAGRVKDMIAIGYQNPINQRLSKSWIIMSELETWKKELYGRTLLEINQEMLDNVLKELDPLSQEIVSYLWQNRHATIVELADLIDAPSHMDVLLRIRGVINPTGEEIIGSPLLMFEKSMVDDETSEIVPFSWWLMGRTVIKDTDKGATRVDIFDDGDRIDIVADLPGVREEDIALSIAVDRVILTAETEDEKYYEEIALPGEVNPDEFMRTYHNNILALSLKKLHYPGDTELKRRQDNDNEMEKSTADSSSFD
ncbi:hypothetical protein ES703_121753 [subsurface metagenome]